MISQLFWAAVWVVGTWVALSIPAALILGRILRGLDRCDEVKRRG